MTGEEVGSRSNACAKRISLSTAKGEGQGWKRISVLRNRQKIKLSIEPVRGKSV